MYNNNLEPGECPGGMECDCDILFIPQFDHEVEEIE